MKRWVLATVLGDGQTIDTPVRTILNEQQDIAIEAGEIPLNPDGTPATTYTLQLVGSRNIAAIRSLDGVTVLPDITYDTRIQAAGVNQRDALTAALAAHGISLASQGLSDQNTMLELINAIGQTLNATFDAEGFDISETDIPNPI